MDENWWNENHPQFYHIYIYIVYTRSLVWRQDKPWSEEDWSSQKYSLNNWTEIARKLTGLSRVWLRTIGTPLSACGTLTMKVHRVIVSLDRNRVFFFFFLRSVWSKKLISWRCSQEILVVRLCCDVLFCLISLIRDGTIACICDTSLT